MPPKIDSSHQGVRTRNQIKAQDAEAQREKAQEAQEKRGKKRQLEPHHSMAKRNPQATKDSYEADKKFKEWRAENPKPTGFSKGRAVEPVDGEPTSDKNEKDVEKLRKKKNYKNDTYRVHFKGTRSHDLTSGNRLIGQKLESRKKWTQDVKDVRDALGDKLEKKGYGPATNDNFAEVSHNRRHAAGGLEDSLGAQPASAHFNTQDAAREEAEDQLHTKRRKHTHDADSVRSKDTVYVHSKGDLQGTIKARRHKLYFKNPTTKQWHKKFDDLQIGGRSEIDKNESKMFKDRVKNLSSADPDVSLHGTTPRGIPDDSSVRRQMSYTPRKHHTTATRSPYFTDLGVGKKTKDAKSTYVRLSKREAGRKMDSLIEEAAKNVRLLRFGKIKG